VQEQPHELSILLNF